MTTTPYRILVTGSRAWNDHDTIHKALADTVRPLPANREIVIAHGACPTGADHIADQWARAYGARPEAHHPEDHGTWPRCGPIRNHHMVTLGADICLAFIGPCTSHRCHRPRPHPSHGASGCADLAERAGIPTRRWTV
ncbi:SLOG family protein [Streptomyces sp. NPDC005483]|uniref:SLOG family protein n=1 Tax=Streptomyces sp. NPDC005483 TaxID=3154882 RepID=UPI0033A1A86A